MSQRRNTMMSQRWKIMKEAHCKPLFFQKSFQTETLICIHLLYVQKQLFFYRSMFCSRSLPPLRENGIFVSYSVPFACLVVTCFFRDMTGSFCSAMWHGWISVMWLGCSFSSFWRCDMDGFRHCDISVIFGHCDIYCSFFSAMWLDWLSPLWQTKTLGKYSAMWQQTVKYIVWNLFQPFHSWARIPRTLKATT